MSQEEQIQISRLRMLCERVVKASSDWNNRAETQYKALNDQIRNVNSIADQLLVCDFTSTPVGVVKSIADTLANIMSHIDDFEAASSDDKMKMIEARARSIGDHYHALYMASTLVVLDHLIIRSKNGQSSLSTIIGRAQDVYDEATVKCAEAVKQCEGELKKVSDMYQKAGIEARAANFKMEADSHNTAANIWLSFGLVTALGIVIYLCIWFEPALVNDAAQEMRIFIALSLSKLVIVSLSTFLLVVCFRNYSANMHNKVVYRSKQVALCTFEQFAKGASDEATRNAILTHACQAIFNAQTSGYLRNEPEPAHSNQIIEIVRGIAGGKP